MTDHPSRLPCPCPRRDRPLDGTTRPRGASSRRCARRRRPESCQIPGSRLGRAGQPATPYARSCGIPGGRDPGASVVAQVHHSGAPTCRGLSGRMSGGPLPPIRDCGRPVFIVIGTIGAAGVIELGRARAA